jgi:NADH-quinone oxidoreductase subunit C
MNPELEALGQHVAQALGEAITHHVVAYHELTLVARAEDIVRVITFLRDDPECGFVWFIDIAGADYPGRERRFDVVYHLQSPSRNRRIRVKVEADEFNPVPSVIGIFPGANWFEREVYDMYGVLFSGHPDLRRILTDYGFEGHPFRKDFPLSGYVEVRYDAAQGRVIYEPVKLTQELRNFDFLSPWEGTDYVLPGDEKSNA